jgi:hypothetical protein
MRSIRRIAAATGSCGLLAAGTFTAVMLVAAPANAGTAGSCTGTGTPSACTVTDLTITSPQSIELNANSSPDDQSVDLTWTTDCTLAGSSQAESGGDDDTTPAWDTLTLGFSNPDSCTVTATAKLSGAGSGSGSTAAPTLTLNVDDNPQAGASSSPTASSTPGPVKSYKLARGFDGKCVDDAGNSKSLRAKIQIWSCNSFDPAQGLTYSGSELHHNNLCLNAKGNGKSGSKVILWTCNGSGNEIWTHKSDGEFVEKANGGKLCLDDPAYSTKNGTQLMVYACNNGPNQHWSLP